MSELFHATMLGSYQYDATTGTAMAATPHWKKKTTTQRVSTIQKNATALKSSANNYLDSTTRKTGIRNNIFMPQPLKLYRKEIASPTGPPTVSRTSLTIASLEMPGSTITVPEAAAPVGTGVSVAFVHQKDTHDSNLSNDHPGPGTCKSFTSNGVCMDAATNARRRCRSSGVLKTNYNSTSYQYLSNRNKTFQQNQYQYMQSGHTSTIPGTSGASQNVYRTQGSASSHAIYDSSGVLSNCTGAQRPFTPVYYKPNNPGFAQQGAVDSSSYILRRKFDSITRNVVQFRKVYGNAVASAMGYGIADSVYTYKDKVGYPLKKTPVIHPNRPRGNCCTHVRTETA